VARSVVNLLIKALEILTKTTLLVRTHPLSEFVNLTTLRLDERVLLILAISTHFPFASTLFPAASLQTIAVIVLIIGVYGPPVSVVFFPVRGLWLSRRVFGVITTLELVEGIIVIIFKVAY
jgi:hypothetical protein